MTNENTIRILQTTIESREQGIQVRLQIEHTTPAGRESVELSVLLRGQAGTLAEMQDAAIDRANLIFELQQVTTRYRSAPREERDLALKAAWQALHPAE
jgi:hypothetical protein